MSSFPANRQARGRVSAIPSLLPTHCRNTVAPPRPSGRSPRPRFVKALPVRDSHQHGGKEFMKRFARSSMTGGFILRRGQMLLRGYERFFNTLLQKRKKAGGLFAAGGDQPLTTR